jgi:uracil phosphoribosyltransferase
MSIHVNIHVSGHPLAEDKIDKLRDIGLSTEKFQEISKELTTLLMYEATWKLSLKEKRIKCWRGYGSFQFLADKEFVIIPILRAGIGMLEGARQIIPGSNVGFLGFRRDHQTLKAIQYHQSLPNKMDESIVFVLDPMLATGNTLVAAVNKIKHTGCKDIRIVCFVAAPEGLRQLTEKHSDIEIYTAAVDERLNSVGYIIPGLGDAGDRMFGVK